jgi:4-amino-4-deoxy-L-arabinose transferase-like glycosyltransferase
MLSAAYVLPGALGRTPWRNADITSVGVMAAMAQGRSAWLSPTLGGVPVDAAPLPHALGALAIKLTSPWIETGLAARLPFVLLLALTLALTWYAAFYLARTEAAQPVAFAFGGEAEHVDYARAIGDGAVLALMASLGLLLLGHETTPELAQLASCALVLWGMAAAPFRDARPRAAVVAGLAMLAASGAPIVAVALGIGATVIARQSRYDNVKALVPWVAGGTLVALATGSLLGQWRWGTLNAFRLDELPGTLKTLVWFLWPAWLLGLWTLWRWRRQALQRHIAVPLTMALIVIVGAIASNGAQRVLMLTLPAMAVLAAFALPTLKRSTAAAMDWFSMFLFSATALFLWVVYVSLQTGLPSKPATNVAKLYAGFESRFEALPFGLALAGTLAWLALVRWRTGRHRSAIWKSLVLPAGGVALAWLLAMTLLLPLADYVRGMKPWVQGLQRHIPRGACVAVPRATTAYVAALDLEAKWTIVAGPQALSIPGCNTAVMVFDTAALAKAPDGWTVIAQVTRPSDRQEVTLVLRRR